MSRRFAIGLLFLAGLASTLALPWRSGGAGTPPPSTPEAAFEALLTDDSAREARVLTPEERLRLLATMRAQGSAPLARFLERVVYKTSAEEPRVLALECLADCATAREIGALVRLATPRENAPSERLSAGLRSAVVQTLARDAKALDELAPAWRMAAAELRPELLAAVAERGDPAGLEFLAWVATFDAGSLHRPLADACLVLAPRARRAAERVHLETLCLLLDSPDGVCVQTISSALARARVEAAIPFWIELLASESRGVRERARRSLEEVTSLALGTPERWLAWYESERDWYEGEAADVLAALASEEDARVLAALRVLSLRRLHRDELAEAVVELLDHPTPAVRSCACSALESLGSSPVVPALAGALADEDPAVSRAAWSALRSLTGLDLPLDEALWRQRLASP